MPIARFEMPDGRIARFEVPEGTSPEAAQQIFGDFVTNHQNERTRQLEAMHKETREKYDPTKGMSIPEKLLAGIGKSLADTYRGGKQLGAHVGGYAGIVSPETVSSIDKEVDEAAALDNPLMDTGAGITGNVAGTIGQVLVPGTMLSKASAIPQLAKVAPVMQTAGQAINAPKNLKTAMATGAALSTINPVEGGDQGFASKKLFQIGTGSVAGALGYGAAKGVERLVSPAQSTANSTIKSVIADGRQLGFETTPAMLSGSKTTQALEQGLLSMPGSAKKIQAVGEHNLKTLARVAAKSIGQNTDDITDDVLANASKKFSQGYDGLRSVGKIPVDSELKVAINDIAAEQLNLSKPLQNKAALSFLDDYWNTAKNGGGIDGKRLVADIKALRKQAYQAIKANDSETAMTKYALADELENFAGRHLTKIGSPNVLNDFLEARKGFANLIAIEKAFDSATGKISGAKLANAMKGVHKGTDLESAAKFMKNFAPKGDGADTLLDKFAFRAAASTAGGGTGALLGADNEDPQAAWRGFLLGSVAPYAASKAIGSAYLSKPVAQNMLNGVPMISRSPNWLKELGRRGTMGAAYSAPLYLSE